MQKDFVTEYEQIEISDAEERITLALKILIEEGDL